MKLKNKVALITGGSSGIGRAIALLFAKQGADVVICSNTSKEKGLQVLEELKSLGSNASYFQIDITKEEDIKNLFENIKLKYKKLDILINNAGRTFNIPFSQITEDSLTKDLKTCFSSAVLCSQEAVKLMKDEGWIVNTSSIRGIDYSGRAGIIGYCAAKSAINSFTKTLAMELSPKIFVSAVAPGFVQTGYMDNVSEEMKESWLKNIPIKKFIQPEEIAEVYLFLATSKIFSGSVITADGGFSLLNR
ncbi:MAG: SDR family NAD(P)-dependent oxidoreductase [Alphaproteobacteria bacterium]